MRLKLISLLLICGLLAGCDKPVNPDGLVEDGPDLSQLQLTGLDGSEARIADFSGKTLIVNFWATWCTPCVKEMPALQAMSDQLSPDHFQVLGVTVDTHPERVQQFLSERQISFAQYSDASMELSMSKLKIRGFPETLIISGEGRLLRRILGPRAWEDREYTESILPSPGG